jgi:mannose/fructose/N-acetylgalactosamine-specific phosphotransferase system component IID
VVPGAAPTLAGRMAVIVGVVVVAATAADVIDTNVSGTAEGEGELALEVAKLPAVKPVSVRNRFEIWDSRAISRAKSSLCAA